MIEGKASSQSYSLPWLTHKFQTRLFWLAKDKDLQQSLLVKSVSDEEKKFSNYSSLTPRIKVMKTFFVTDTTETYDGSVCAWQNISA